MAKHKSFSLAANELHTVQPAISRHISALESELGINLFNRNSRDVAITQAGEQLLNDAKAILALTEQAKARAELANMGQLGTLKIAYLSSACFSFMAGLVRTYKSHFPHIHVSLFEMSVTEQIKALESEEVDIAFSRPLPSTLNSEYLCHDIYIDKLVAIVNKNHHLATKSKVGLSELKAEPFIIFNREEAIGLFDEIIMQCKQAGFSPNLVSQPKQMQTLLTEVAAGFGVAIAPLCISKLYSEGCHFVDLKRVTTQIPLQLQYKKNHSAAVSKFAEMTLSTQDQIQLSMMSH